MPQPSARERFFHLLRAALDEGSLVKLTLGKYRGTDASLKNLFVRPVTLKAGPQFAFLWRHGTRDITKNQGAIEALAQLESLVGGDFLDAHLFTATQQAQLECQPNGESRLRVRAVAAPRLSPPPAHDQVKQHLIRADAPWLRALGVTNDRGHPREGMSDKFRQIQKFAELLSHLLEEAFPESTRPAGGSRQTPPIRVVDMGSGKGYLTFAVAELLGARAEVCGIELRDELVETCNRVARENGFAPRLSFSAGSIADARLAPCDVLIALHACDTATDDALAHGISAGARLLVVAPCCQKELRPQLTPPSVLAGALRHGIFQERHSEFVTDALRAQLLEIAGFRTKVFEFISTEHTAKNLMISAIQGTISAETQAVARQRLREFAQFYGIRRQRLAEHLGVPF